VEYPLKEAVVVKRKFMRVKSYSLAFQGGGAKGVAYVGAYQAIKEMSNDGKPVPITSIMGSSAGGIIALAVSTGIAPEEVQKICYKMGTIPRADRIDRHSLRKTGEERYSTDERIDEEKSKMLRRVVELLNEYGIVQKKAVEEVVSYVQTLDKKKIAVVVQRLVNYLLVSSESIGQIFDYKEGDSQEFNYLGLLLEGALMRGEAIHDIGSECLVKYVLANYSAFEQETHRAALGIELSRELSEFVNKFDSFC
jgi:hypothetical protein